MFSNFTHPSISLQKFSLFLAFIVLAFTSTVTPALAQENNEPAGQLLFTHGTVELTRNEEVSPASRGLELINQDAITTHAASSAQVRFSDNSLVAIRPESTFLIENYNFDEEQPEEGKQSTQLIRGSLRAMTGAIGQARPENVEFKTPVATMGIRGTVLSIVHIPEGEGGIDGSLSTGTYIQVEQGAVEVANNSGTQLVNAGETVYVENENTPPVPAPENAENYIASQQTQDNDEDDEEDSENNDTTSNNDDGEGNQNNQGNDSNNSANDSGNNNQGNNQDENDPVTPPDNSSTDQGEEEIEENRPDPEPLPEWGLDFSPYGIFGILAEGSVTTAGEFTIDEYSTTAMSFNGGESFESGYFNTSNYYSTSNSDINWARWAVGNYELVNSLAEDIDTGFDFMYLLTSNPILNLESLEAIAARSLIYDDLRFSFAGGPGVSLSNGNSFSIGQNSFVSITNTGSINIEINFGYNTSDANRTMTGEASFADLFAGFIALTESGAEPIILDGTRLVAVASGTEEWGFDAFLAALNVLLEDPETQEQVEGYGMLAFVNDCIVNFPCPFVEPLAPLAAEFTQMETLGSNGQVTIHTDAFNSFVGLSNIFALAAQQSTSGDLRAYLTNSEGNSFSDENNTFMLETESGENLRISWGFWESGAYEAYTHDAETGEASWLNNDGNYHYFLVSESIITETPTTGSASFEVVGGSGLVSENDGRVLPFLEGDISVNFDEQSMGVLFVFDNNGNQAVLSGNNLDLLAFLNHEEGITLVSEEFDSGSMFGGFVGEGLEALIAMLEATLDEEAFRGTGVFQSYANAEPLPEWGESFTPYGIFAELAEGATFPTMSNFLDSYSTGSLTFEGLNEEDLESFGYGGFNTANFYASSNSNIVWARWADGNYELTDSLGETLETNFDFMYLLADNSISELESFNSILTEWHSDRELQFTLFDSPGFTLSNGNEFSIGYNSSITLDTNNDTISIAIDFGYHTEGFDRQLVGEASFADLFNSFIALEESGANPIILDGTRLIGAVSGSSEWGIDALLASLFILLEDPETQEQIEGYGMLSFVHDCVVNFPCPILGNPISLADTSELEGGAIGGNSNDTLRSDAQNTFLVESLAAQEDTSESLRFIAQSEEGFNHEQFGTFSLETGSEELLFVWGHWTDDSYQLYRHNEDNTVNEHSNDSNYHFVITSNLYTGDLPTSGVRNYDYAAGSGLVSETDGRVLPMLDGQLSVDFDNESMGLLFIFNNEGDELVLSGTNLDLWQFLTGSGAVTLEGQGFDYVEFSGSFAGANMEALMTLIRAYASDESFAGSGIFAYTPPIDVATVGNNLTLAGYLDRERNFAGFQAELGPNGVFPILIESEDLVFRALDMLPESHDSFALSNWNPDSSSVLDWGVWSPGTYELQDTAGYLLDSSNDFPFLLADNRLSTLADYQDVVAAQHSGESELHFTYGGGTGVNLSNDEQIWLGGDSLITVNLSDNSMTFDLGFTYTAEEEEVLRTLFGAGSIEDFYNSFIELEETTSGDLIIDLARMYGTYTGNSDVGLEALLTGLYLTVQNNDEIIDGYGLHYFLYCYMGESCEIPNFVPEDNVGVGLSIAGYFERVRDFENFQANIGADGNIVPTYIHNNEFTFESQVATPSITSGFNVANWNNDSTTVIDWGVFAPGEYTLTDAVGLPVSNNHVFPYMMSDNTLGNYSDASDIIATQQSSEGTMTFALGGGSDVQLSNAETVELGDGSRVYIDVANESVTFELDFTYSGEGMEVLRTLIGSGSVEDFYNAYIELDETTSGAQIVELARMYGALTGTEEQGIDALLTGLYLAVQDSFGSSGHGFGLHYFLYCWMGSSCELPNPDPEEPPEPLMYGGLMERGYFPGGGILSSFYVGSFSQGSWVYGPRILETEEYTFRHGGNPENTNVYLSSALFPNAGPRQASYWGSYSSGTWGFYAPEDSDYLDPLEGSGEHPFTYAFTIDPYNLNTSSNATAVLGNYNSPMSFKFLGGTEIHFSSGEHLAMVPTSSVSVDPNTNTISFQIDVAYSGEGFDFIHELAGSGDIESLYNHYIELVDQSSNPIVDTARIFGQLTGTNVEQGAIGNMNTYQNIDGVLAALLVSLIGEETEFGMGTIAFAHCYVNNDCSFTNLPTIPGMNLTNAGILDRDLQAMVNEGSATIEEVSAGVFAPTQVETQAYSFEVNEFAIPESYDAFNVGMINEESMSTISWGIWGGETYTLLNYWGDELDNSQDMPYLISDHTISNQFSAESIYQQNHTGTLQFNIFGGPGMQLSNSESFDLAPTSHIQINLDATLPEDQIYFSFDYMYGPAVEPGYIYGNGSLEQLYNDFIALTADDAYYDFNDVRFYGALSGDMSWGLDAILGGLYVDFMDEQQVTGYGLYAFLLCMELNEGACTMDPELPIGMFVSDYYPFGNPVVFEANNAIGNSVLSNGENSLLFDVFQEGNPLLVMSGEGVFGESGHAFNVMSDDPYMDWNGGTETIDTLGGVEQEEVQWGYWAPESYELVNVNYESNNYPIDNTSPYFYMVVSNATDVEMLPMLASDIGYANYNLAGGSGGLINTSSGDFTAITSGQFYVDFYSESYSVNLDFGNGNSLTAMQESIYDLFEYNTVFLEGSGIFGGGTMHGTFIGPEAEGIAAMIDAWLYQTEEVLRGVTVFERMP